MKIQIRMMAMLVLVAMLSIGFSGCDFFDKSMKIETPYGTISYPEKYAEDILIKTVEENGICTVAFFGKTEGRGEQRLFDIVFGPSGKYKVGSINGVDVCIDSYDLDTEQWTEEEREKIYGMQESIDFVVNSLDKIKGFVEVGNEIEKEDHDSVIVKNLIKTPYGNIGYPAEWSADMVVSQKEENGNLVISFVAIIGEKKAPVFDIIFGVTEGIPLGIIKDGDGTVEIYVIPMEPNQQLNFSSSDVDAFYEIQSRIDYIISEVEKFENAEIL